MSIKICSTDSEWKKSSDDWVKTMEESAKNKELYQQYASKTNKPIPYRDWLKEQL